MKKLYIFTLPYCSFCKNLTTELQRKSISFTPIAVPDNRELFDNIKKQLGVSKLNAPVLFFRENNDGEGYIYEPAKDFQTVDDAITIIRNNIED